MKQTLFFALAMLIAMATGCGKSSSPTDTGNGEIPQRVPTSVSISLRTEGSAYNQSGDTIYVAEKDKIWVQVMVYDQNGKSMGSPENASVKANCGTVSYPNQTPTSNPWLWELRADSLVSGWNKTGQVTAEFKTGNSMLTSNTLKVTVAYKFFYGKFTEQLTPGGTATVEAAQRGNKIYWGASSPASYVHAGLLTGNQFSLNYPGGGGLSYNGSITNRNTAQGAVTDTIGYNGTFVFTRQ